MKRSNWAINLGVGLCVAFMCTSCAVTSTPNGIGGLYTNAKYESPALAAPIDQGAKPLKYGKGTLKNILGIVVWGDASLNEAMRQGGILKIHHVDIHNKSILGIYCSRSIVVYGE